MPSGNSTFTVLPASAVPLTCELSLVTSLTVGATGGVVCVADDQGNYTIDLPANKKFNGGESIKITSTDASGNKSDEAVVEVKDTTPPVAPTVSEVTSCFCCSTYLWTFTRNFTYRRCDWWCCIFYIYDFLIRFVT